MLWIANGLCTGLPMGGSWVQSLQLTGIHFWTTVSSSVISALYLITVSQIGGTVVRFLAFRAGACVQLPGLTTSGLPWSLKILVGAYMGLAAYKYSRP